MESDSTLEARLGKVEEVWFLSEICGVYVACCAATLSLDELCSARIGGSSTCAVPRKDRDRKIFDVVFFWLRFCDRCGIRLWETLDLTLLGLVRFGVPVGRDREEELCSDFQSSDNESSQGSMVDVVQLQCW